MPDQVIDFSTLDTVVFNGTELTEVVFNGVSIWTIPLETWPQIGSDIIGTGASDGAGISVALNDTGNIVAYTSPYNIDGGADSGEVRVFERIGNTWTQIGSDIEGAPSELATNSGGGTHCVALNGAGDILATSWPGNDDVFGGNTDAGQVRVYKNVSNTWTLTGGDINALTSDTRLGAYNGLSLNTAGNIIAVGGWLGGDQSPGISDPGVVRVYEMVASAWTQIGQTLSGETTGVPGDYNENADYNGYSVDLNGAGNILIAGAPYNDNNDYPNSSTAGHARVFELINGTWAQIGSDIDGGDAFLQYGLDTSINTAGNIVAVGGYGGGTNIVDGVVRVYENINGTWTQIGSDIVGVDADDRAGYSVELNGAGDIIAVGDVIHDTTSANDVGRMRIFKNIDGEWVQHAADIVGSAANEYAGWSVALNNQGDVAAVGSPGYVTPGDTITYPGRGRVRVYQAPPLLEFVPIGNAGNFADTTGYGDVSYEYRIARYAISEGDITTYNADSVNSTRQITLDNRGTDKPATSVSWNEAARYVNWLNEREGEQAAYNFTTGGVNDNITLWSSASAWQAGGENLYRHKDAKYFLPSEDEWYKAAYYNGSIYYDYPTGSDSAPTSVTSGTTTGTAVYDIALSNPPADVTQTGGLSPYGTMGQGGNAYELIESAADGINNSTSETRVIRGGSPYSGTNFLQSSFRTSSSPGSVSNLIGFRVAAVSV